VNMSTARKFLLLVGSLFVLIGLVFLLLPAQSAGLVDVEAKSATALIEIQGFYGGQMIGIGILVLAGALQSSLTSAALLVTIASLGGTAAGRLFGALGGGELPLRMAALFVLETGTAAVAVVLLMRRGT